MPENAGANRKNQGALCLQPMSSTSMRGARREVRGAGRLVQFVEIFEQVFFVVLRFRWLALCLLLLVAAGVVRLAAWQGWWSAVRVSGGSMADALPGEHYCLGCAECGFAIRYDAAAPPADQRVVCPNCGAAGDHLRDGIVRRGQRVVIDRLAYRCQAPARWDVVAFGAADDPQRLSVKRVGGLPGERVEIRRGDLYVDGRPARKALDQLRSLAILVHDDGFRARWGERLRLRWRWGTTSGWRSQPSGYRFAPGSEPAVGFDWLAYEHWPGFAGHLPRKNAAPILDNYAYNQNVSRPLHAVEDVMLVCRLATPARSGQAAFEVRGRSGAFRIVLDFAVRTIQLVSGETVRARLDLPRAAYARGVKIELALCDGQLLFAIDGQELIRHNYQTDPGTPAADPPHGARYRLRIGMEDCSAVLDRLRVFRDLHYLAPHALSDSWQSAGPLGPAEVFVLGDNSPISVDGRHGSPVAVAVGDLLGKVSRW